MSEVEYLGPCTITVSLTEGTEPDFAGEFLGVHITHTYETVGANRRMLDGTRRKARKERTDGCTGNTENDLTAAGLYTLLEANDQVPATVTITQTASGASWTGIVELTLPADVGADDFGSPIISTITWEAQDHWAFTPGTVPAAP